MKELKFDADHVVTDEAIADLIGVPAAQIQDTLFLHHMAFADGSLAIRAHAYFNAELTFDRPKEIFQFEITDNGTHCHDLSSHAIPRQKAPYAGNNWTSIPIGDDILYLQGTSHAFLVSRGADPVIRDVAIEQALGDVWINEKVSASLRPSRNAHPVSEGKVAVIPLSNGGDAKYLAVLTLDPDTLRALEQFRAAR